MGRRARRRGTPVPEAPKVAYERGAQALVLRTVLSPGTRREYAEIGGVRDDAWQRRVEFLFERLADRWAIEGIEVPRRDLLARFRFTTPEERSAVRDVLREHLAEHFPDLEAP